MAAEEIELQDVPPLLSILPTEFLTFLPSKVLLHCLLVVSKYVQRESFFVLCARTDQESLDFQMKLFGIAFNFEGADNEFLNRLVAALKKSAASPLSTLEHKVGAEIEAASKLAMKAKQSSKEAVMFFLKMVVIIMLVFIVSDMIQWAISFSSEPQ